MVWMVYVNQVVRSTNPFNWVGEKKKQIYKNEPFGGLLLVIFKKKRSCTLFEHTKIFPKYAKINLNLLNTNSLWGEPAQTMKMLAVQQPVHSLYGGKLHKTGLFLSGQIKFSKISLFYYLSGHAATCLAVRELYLLAL